MSDPLIDPGDLATYLNDDSLDTARATDMIGYAQTLCESILSPLPDEAAVVVIRVAARGYVTTTAARQYQLGMADAGYGTQPGPVGGVYLTRADKTDLRRLTGGGGAFSIDLLPADYAPCLPPWDANVSDWGWQQP